MKEKLDRLPAEIRAKLETHDWTDGYKVRGARGHTFWDCIRCELLAREESICQPHNYAHGEKFLVVIHDAPGKWPCVYRFGSRTSLCLCADCADTNHPPPSCPEVLMQRVLG